MKYIFSLFFLFVSFTSLYSCVSKSDNQSFSQYTDSAKIIDRVEIERFDKDLYNFLRFSSKEREDSLKTKYQEFLGAFGSVTIDNSDYDGQTYFLALTQYFSNNTLEGIYKDVLNRFDSVEEYENQLTEASRLIELKLEGKRLPQLCMHVSGFKANTIVLENMISLSTDKYLGSDYPIYKQFFEEYQRNNMVPKMIVRDYLKAFLMTELPLTVGRKDLLSEMIKQGKIIYALQQLLPEWSEADLIGYTEAEIDWSYKNEKRIWEITVKQNYLYSNDFMILPKYLEDAPYTATISPDSPSRLGIWLGLQIIKKYAQTTKANLNDILNNTDSQTILKMSKYNP